MEFFNSSMIDHVHATESEHCALVVGISKLESTTGASSNRLFKIENAWTRHANYVQIVENVWVWVPTNGNLQRVTKARVHVNDGLQKWSREEFGSIHKSLKMQSRLEKLRAN